MNIENLYSISALEDEMCSAAVYYRSLGQSENIVNEEFHITDELRDSREIFERLNDTLSASWEIMYEHAAEYYNKYGNLNVQKRYKTPDGYSLGSWIYTQRKVRRGEIYGRLDSSRIARLDKIGMIWKSVKDISWERYYSEAQRYSKEHGNLLVPAKAVCGGVKLGAWIANLRTYRKSSIKSGYLTEERVKLLDAIGMVWDVPDYVFERNYSAALAFYREFGNLDVPVSYVSMNGIRLGTWIHALQSEARTGKLSITEAQAERLNELGMLWTSKSERTWERGCDEAEKYFTLHGNLNVPCEYVTEQGYRLGAWVRRQRGDRDKLSEDRKRRLERIGMVWDGADPWEYRFALAEEYYRKNGNLRVPGGYNVSGVDLGKWINEQKQAYRGNRRRALSDEQVKRLEAIGMDWRSSYEACWERTFESLRSYYEKHGNINISGSAPAPDERSLGRWICVQRRYYSSGRLTKEQIAKLNSVGMTWKSGR